MSAPNLPADLELRTDITQQDMLDVLSKHANLLLFGREEEGDANEPGELTAFRAVVLVGGMVGLSADGQVVPVAIGLLNGDESSHSKTVWPKLADKLREIARDIDMFHGPKGAA